jgi:hypothetical protein
MTFTVTHVLNALAHLSRAHEHAIVAHYCDAAGTRTYHSREMFAELTEAAESLGYRLEPIKQQEAAE